MPLTDRRFWPLLIPAAAAVMLLWAYRAGYLPKYQGPAKTPWEAIGRGDLPRLKTLIAQDPAALQATRKDGETLLHVAAREDRQGDVIRYLLSMGLAADARNSIQETPLHQAAMVGSAAAVEILVKAEPSLVNATDKWGRTPLHEAAEALFFSRENRDQRLENRAAVARVLIQSGADVSAHGHFGRTPLHDAASNGLAGVARVLIEAGADPAARVFESFRPPNFPGGESALQFAARRGHVAVVKLLLEHNAPVILPGDTNYARTESALHDACNPLPPSRFFDEEKFLPGYTGDLEVIDLLMERVGDPNIVAGGYYGLSLPYSSGTPLQVAAGLGHGRIARHIVSKYPNAVVAFGRNGPRADDLLKGSEYATKSKADPADVQNLLDLLRERAAFQLAGMSATQAGKNTPPRLDGLTYGPPKVGLDFAGHVTGTVVDETRRPATYRIEVDLDGDGKSDKADRYPADRWGFSFPVMLPPGPHELWFRAVEREVGCEKPAEGDWQRLAFTVVPPPNEPPWIDGLFFSPAEGRSVQLRGGFDDLTSVGSNYRVEIDVDGDGAPDFEVDHYDRDKSRRSSDWGVQHFFDATLEAPKGGPAVRARAVELRDGVVVATSAWRSAKEWQPLSPTKPETESRGSFDL
jgi:hypothetical protein